MRARLFHLLVRPGHVARVSGGMPNGVDDDLSFANLIEDEIGIWRGAQPPYSWIIGRDSHVGMVRQQIHDGLNAVLYAARSLR